MKPILTKEEEKQLAETIMTWNDFKNKVLEPLLKKYDYKYVQVELNHYRSNIQYYLRELEKWLMEKMPEYLQSKTKKEITWNDVCPEDRIQIDRDDFFKDKEK